MPTPVADWEPDRGCEECVAVHFVSFALRRVRLQSVYVVLNCDESVCGPFVKFWTAISAQRLRLQSFQRICVGNECEKVREKAFCNVRGDFQSRARCF
jgi:hypothetical protein